MLIVTFVFANHFRVHDPSVKLGSTISISGNVNVIRVCRVFVGYRVEAV